MTRDFIERRLQRIRDAAGDYEIAHGIEDGLHREVLEAIGSGTLVDMTPAIACQLACRSFEIDFNRHCA